MPVTDTSAGNSTVELDSKTWGRLTSHLAAMKLHRLTPTSTYDEF